MKIHHVNDLSHGGCYNCFVEFIYIIVMSLKYYLTNFLLYLILLKLKFVMRTLCVDLLPMLTI